jgi:hypothetical protein
VWCNEFVDRDSYQALVGVIMKLWIWTNSRLLCVVNEFLDMDR